MIPIPQKPLSEDGTTTSNTNVKPQTLIGGHYKRNHLIKSVWKYTTQKCSNDKTLKEIAEAAYIPRKITSFAGKMCWFAI